MNGPLKGAAAVWYDQCFQLLRTTGWYDRGVYKRGTPTITMHMGRFQPASQRDIQRLPEGSRADGAVVLFTDCELRTTEADNQVADRIMYRSTEYEVSGVEEWESHGRYTLTKVGQ